MSIVKLSGGGLFILNPIAATRELLDMVHSLEKQHGPVKHVVLSTVAIEHKAYAGCGHQSSTCASIRGLLGSG